MVFSAYNEKVRSLNLCLKQFVLLVDITIQPYLHVTPFAIAGYNAYAILLRNIKIAFVRIHKHLIKPINSIELQT